MDVVLGGWWLTIVVAEVWNLRLARRIRKEMRNAIFYDDRGIKDVKSCGHVYEFVIF